MNWVSRRIHNAHKRAILYVLYELILGGANSDWTPHVYIYAWYMGAHNNYWYRSACLEVCFSDENSSHHSSILKQCFDVLLTCMHETLRKSFWVIHSTKCNSMKAAKTDKPRPSYESLKFTKCVEVYIGTHTHTHTHTHTQITNVLTGCTEKTACAQSYLFSNPITCSVCIQWTTMSCLLQSSRCVCHKDSVL